MFGVPLTQFVRPFLVSPDARKQLTVPVLVWEKPAQLTGPGDALWVTQVSAPTQTGRPADEAKVFEVKKGTAKTNAFALGITIGRTENNDIVLSHESVSRFQAYFQQDARGKGWTLTDAGSRNGTFIADRKMDPSKAEPIASQARLRFGLVAVQFMLPEDFFRYVDVMAGR